MPGECAVSLGAASWQPCRGNSHWTALSEEKEAGQGDEMGYMGELA